jgi:hypothetical protein
VPSPIGLPFRRIAGERALSEGFGTLLGLICCSQRFCSRARLLAVLRPKSAQRELNPHFRLGKAIGFRYIMGTVPRRQIVKECESTGWDSNPRCRITGAGSWPLDDQCSSASGTRGARTLTRLVKSQALCR